MIINILLGLFTALLAAWVAIFALQILAALRACQRGDSISQLAAEPTDADKNVHCSYAVLIPAHDEAKVIGATLDALNESLDSRGRIVVVADNCSDATAAIARAAGAEVIERFNTDLRGKGFALDCGLRHLAAQAPDVVVVFDADCQFAAAADLPALAEAALNSGRPVQAHYAMRVRGDEGTTRKVDHFAWRIKNFLRPLGMRYLGMPCQLMGTGMAFPWSQIANAQIASDDIVEDMSLGLALAMQGTAPLFLPSATVCSDFPDQASARTSQRSRWEHGHMQTILFVIPPLLGKALLRRNGAAAGLLADLSVPPLTLLVLLVAVHGSLSVLATLLTGWLGWAAFAVAIWLALGLSLSLAWHRVAREIIGFRDLLGIAEYLCGKLQIYASFLFGRQKTWVRTERYRQAEDC
ncbi:glycosyltransferase [Mangrovimicrobium sediminis]|uniref:Glycosyltransferase n=1 Tax=Mangrovimicrobium sediminis TaxID=2562682 RepID=A0A4Z0M3M3_9GAMM|nr:glycosyltransferase [Haliea sp. SAOS-164]TGD73968.1 glycosyltransferase [Haliea sp. SAOS-164]